MERISQVKFIQTPVRTEYQKRIKKKSVPSPYHVLGTTQALEIKYPVIAFKGISV